MTSKFTRIKTLQNPQLMFGITHPQIELSSTDKTPRLCKTKFCLSNSRIG